ncbi:hypothetical protein ACFS5L_20040 [Streptomyces phyllanthi]|uniref:Uncharacterized protein n=1 Tax=Streptomyces phyllanthi TaxID=1803180 RepID=A0A5N8WI70_9ACTN|nr:hypothetical protein [Streptomyces phyllanthi]MPY46596.1 hypothetical protein [Streptomyces phyllanthi]
MSAATFSPVPARHGPPPGATALDVDHHRHWMGDAMRAIKVFAGAAFEVVVLGEYAEEAGVHRR